LKFVVQREGLFYRFEHTRDQYTLVIADHNGAFKPGAQPDIRHTNSASLKEDSFVGIGPGRLGPSPYKSVAIATSL
jgi:uncharacterized protein involved in type VI secretion and phage assembly